MRLQKSFNIARWKKGYNPDIIFASSSIDNMCVKSVLNPIRALNIAPFVSFVMYCEWYGVCDFVVLSVREVCTDYGGVYVFHVCFDLCIVYGVGTGQVGLVIGS